MPSSTSFTVLWDFLLCFLSAEGSLYSFSQWTHLLFSPRCTDFICLSLLFLEWKPFLQCRQIYILFICLECMWVLKPDLVLNNVLHISHFSVSFTCTLFMWSFKLVFFVNDLSHSMHWCCNFLCSQSKLCDFVSDCWWSLKSKC